MTDRAKEGLFSSLGEAVEGAAVLDLFAGSGSLGIEAMSRGAKSAVFVDLGKEAVAALRENIRVCGFGPQSEVVVQTVLRYLRSAPADTFDLVFFDPPWAMPDPEQQQDFDLVPAAMRPDGTVVVNRRSSTGPLETAPGLVLAADKRYGDGKIWRYVKETT
jgi:16S rRNA (guanine966-N2)-methyltransferase